MVSTLELYNALAGKASARSLAGYLDYVVCDSRPPRRLSLIREPWQDTLYGLLAPLFESAAGIKEADRKAAFIVAPRGHDKTSGVARLLNWCLCYARRPITATAAAADKDQARILLDRMKKEAAHNPFLGLDFRNYQVIGPTGVLDVISSDAPSSSGRLDDIIILDEISWWDKRDLFDILISGRNKRRDGVLVVISNAGCRDTWQYDLWQEAQANPRWITYTIPPFSASWLDRAAIEEDRKILLPSIFRRLHLNEWVDLNEENCFLTRDQVGSMVDPALAYRARGEPGLRYVAAIDYGSVNDRSVAVVVHAEGDTIVLDRMDVWQGSQERPVPFTAVEGWIDDVLKNFKLRQLVLDPWELRQTAQKYERRVEVERFSFGGGSHFALAENLRSLVLTGRLRTYPGAGELTLDDGRAEDLVDEMSSLIVVEKQWGVQYRLDHVEGRHDDRTIALGMAALACVQLKKAADPTVILEKLLQLKKKEEEEMDYHQIKKVHVYGTYQACPVVNGEELRLTDYPTMHEAAFAVNEAHRLLDGTPPNALSVERQPAAKRQEEIRDELVKLLKSRKLLKEPAQPARERRKKEEK